MPCQSIDAGDEDRIPHSLILPLFRPSGIATIPPQKVPPLRTQ
jgi:hypothetical protein